jgi:chemosensory pili system protein ChpA (sensor histidine kinase/response regulator)
MSEAFHPFDDSELSAEDLAVIQAFDKLKWNDEPSSVPVKEFSPMLQGTSEDFVREMLLLFVDEVSDDLVVMVKVGRQLAEAQPLLPEHFTPLRRGGHKIRGSAGVVDCQSLAIIAGHVEDIAELVLQQQIAPEPGLRAIALALIALEETLESIVANGKEDQAPLARLIGPLEELIGEPDFSAAATSALPAPTAELLPFQKPEEYEYAFLRVEPVRVEQLSLHSQQLNELRISLESSQTQFTQALQELHMAQARLRQLQPMLSALFSNPLLYPPRDEHSSSLIARILAEAEQPDEHGYVMRKPREGRKPRGTSGPALWDELDIERYSEQDLLIRSLNEAIADVSLISMRVQTLSEQHNLTLQLYMNQVALVHDGVRKLRLMPLRVLLPEIREFIQHLSTRIQTLEFDVQGEHVEVDQTILDTLALPLLHLLQVCLSDMTISAGETIQASRVWFHAQQLNNEVALEIGFSMPVSGGALDGIREPLQRLNGSVSMRRNAADGMSFYLRFPRAYGEVHCLLVRVDAEHFLVPTSQVQRVSDYKREVLHTLYDLGHLLNLPSSTHADVRIQPVLVLPSGNSSVLIGVVVDEVIDEMELVVKTLPTYLQRPGISSSAIDGRGSVLLLLDLPELIRSAATRTQRTPFIENENVALLQRPDTATIVIADDSVSMRQSLHQTLNWDHYNILEAQDGIIALELLLEHIPDMLILDIEMPNLNGYELLRAMCSYPQLAHVKTVVLTSRSSEKHKSQAYKLGADLYMIKPVPPDVLLATVKNLLASS